MLGTEEEKAAYLGAVIEAAADRAVAKLQEMWAERTQKQTSAEL